MNTELIEIFKIYPTLMKDSFDCTSYDCRFLSSDLGPHELIYCRFVFGLREWNVFVQVVCRRFI